MKSLKHLFAVALIALFVSASMSSCMTTRTPVGEFPAQTGNTYTYAKGKQIWLFWGIMPIGRTNVNTPQDGNCEVVTQFRFVDFLISGLTGGIVSSYSIQVNAKQK